MTMQSARVQTIIICMYNFEKNSHYLIFCKNGRGPATPLGRAARCKRIFFKYETLVAFLSKFLPKIGVALPHPSGL